MNILIVEDDAGVREGIAEILSAHASVRVAGTLAEADAALRQEHFDVVLTDLRIGHSARGGLIVLGAARKLGAKVVVIGASTREEIDLAVGQTQPDAVLTKPFLIEEVEALIAGLRVRNAG
ncbi:MAG: response regulator [Myxococcota bacterium]